jgi:hypothetical protein
MFMILTSPSVPMVNGRVCHCDHINHCLETLDLCIYLFVVLRQQRSELVNDHPRDQGIEGKSAVDLLALPLDPADFLVKRPIAVLESLLYLGCCPLPPRGDTILNFILLCSKVILLALMSLLSYLVHLTCQMSCPGDFCLDISSDLFHNLIIGGFTRPHHENLLATVEVRLW